MKKILILLAVVGMLVACGTSKVIHLFPQTITLKFNAKPTANLYRNLDYGIRLNISDKRNSIQIIDKLDFPGKELKTHGTTSWSLKPDVEAFVSESMSSYMKILGFDLNADFKTDYQLQVDVKQFHVDVLGTVVSGRVFSDHFSDHLATIGLDIQLLDADRNIVYPLTSVTGKATAQGVHLINVNTISKILNEAFVDALEKINWDRIAYFLTRAKTPSAEKNKQVQGDGDTALEHSVIRWFVDSAPKGADVYWRVVSSTPDVKNTNQSYLGTTPYESTESFDIRGLTYNNSGNVQIEISCEKAGYSTQKKRFNLRQAIDQKEISTKFNLVAE